MLSEYFYKIKGWLKENENDFFTALIIILTAISAFGLGRLSAIYDAKAPLVIKNSTDIERSYLEHRVFNNGGGVDNSIVQNPAATEKYLASKNGKKYYPADCPAAARIAEANRIWFSSAAEAEGAGFSLSASC